MFGTIGGTAKSLVEINNDDDDGNDDNEDKRGAENTFGEMQRRAFAKRRTDLQF